MNKNEIRELLKEIEDQVVKDFDFSKVSVLFPLLPLCYLLLEIHKIELDDKNSKGKSFDLLLYYLKEGINDNKNKIKISTMSKLLIYKVLCRLEQHKNIVPFDLSLSKDVFDYVEGVYIAEKISEGENFIWNKFDENIEETKWDYLIIQIHQNLKTDPNLIISLFKSYDLLGIKTTDNVEVRTLLVEISRLAGVGVEFYNE